MAIQTDITHFNVSNDYTEIEMFICDGEDAPYNFARVTVHVENRDWLFSELKVEAVRKAKAFLSQALSSLPD